MESEFQYRHPNRAQKAGRTGELLLAIRGFHGADSDNVFSISVAVVADALDGGYGWQRRRCTALPAVDLKD